MVNNQQVFICFSAKDRYEIAEPIVHHLKNYGIDIWYDRYTMVMGDNRERRNLIEGAMNCKYSLIILSKNTINSKCAMEEINILKNRHIQGNIIIFPVLYEIAPDYLPQDLQWIKELIFKEVDKRSGTREICNHIACKITKDILSLYKYQNVRELVSTNLLPVSANEILKSYFRVDTSNLNSRISLLYAAYLTIINSKKLIENTYMVIITKIYERLINETSLNLDIDYRELWLLENAICILGNLYLSSCTESNM